MRGNRVCLACRPITIMAGITVVDTTGIVRPGAAHEGCGGMTGGTIQAGINMGGHGIYHTLRIIAIMTPDAIVRDAGMVDRRRFEGTGRMADTAILTGHDMTDFFRRGKTGIVAGCAVVHYAHMIKGCRFKPGGLVAVPAISVGRHMVGRGRFSPGGCTIVARRTGIIDTDKLVIKPGTGEGCRIMAQRTIVADWDMGRVDLGRGADGIDPVVAGRTVVHDPGMIEYSRLKAATGGVADLAILGCIKVAGVPTFCPASPIGYMTGIAAYGQHCRVVVVDKHSGKINRVMAQGTVRRGCRVRGSSCLASGAKRNKTRTAIVAGGTIAGNACVCQHRCWFETCNRMTDVAILAGRQVVCILNKQWQRIGKDSADMATFTPTGNGCNVIKAYMVKSYSCKGNKADIVTISALILCRDMVKFLSYRPKRNIIGIAVMAGFALGRDLHVTEVRCWLERYCRTVAKATILARRQMGSWFSV